MTGWSSVLPLLGVVVGAALQYWLSKSAETRKQLQLLQSQCYVDYLRAVTRSAHARLPDEITSVLVEATDAKARLAVYGAPAVIVALARFEKAGPDLNKHEARACFVALVGEMRQGGRTVLHSDLSLVLFGRQAELPRTAEQEQMDQPPPHPKTAKAH